MTQPHCDECGSTFDAEASAMESLCAECAHRIYGYPPCDHEFLEGRCGKCGWDGSTTPFTRSAQDKA